MPSTMIDRIDNVTTSAAVKVACRMGTTGNVTLSGLQTIDGIDGADGDRVLVKNQTNTVENGIYVMQATAWFRDYDFDGARDAVTGTTVQVLEGTIQTATWWNLTSPDPVNIGYDAITWEQNFISLTPVGQATETAAGIAEIATQAETNAGTDDARFITPKKLAAALQNGGYYWAGTFTGTANALLCTLTPDPGQYYAGMRIVGVSISTPNSSGGVTVNANSLGLKSVAKFGSQALSAGDLGSGMLVELYYDGTQFQLANAPAALDHIVNGRITLTSGVAVTTSDVTAAATVYFTPHRGNKATLYDGAVWRQIVFSEMSVAVPSNTNTPFDVFLDWNSGSPQLVATAWTNDTTRATALTLLAGRYVKSGTTTQLYLGTCRTTGTSGQTEDSITNRYVWNYYNRVPRPMQVRDATATWTYSSSAAFRQANGNTANQVNFVYGVAEDIVSANVVHSAVSSTSTGRSVTSGIGIDSTSVNSSFITSAGTASSNGQGISVSLYNSVPAVGKHSFVWLERGGGADTQTWFGNNQNGLTANILG